MQIFCFVTMIKTFLAPWRYYLCFFQCHLDFSCSIHFSTFSISKFLFPSLTWFIRLGISSGKGRKARLATGISVRPCYAIRHNRRFPEARWDCGHAIPGNLMARPLLALWDLWIRKRHLFFNIWIFFCHLPESCLQQLVRMMFLRVLCNERSVQLYLVVLLIRARTDFTWGYSKKQTWNPYTFSVHS